MFSHNGHNACPFFKRILKEVVDKFFETSRGTIAYRVEQNRRLKRMRVVVSIEDGVVVETPYQLNPTSAKKLIKERQDWIHDSLQHYSSAKKKLKEVKKHANSVLIFGKEKLFTAIPNQRKNFFLENQNEIFLGLTDSNSLPELVLAEILKRRAKRYLPLRTHQLNQRFRFKLESVSVKNQKTLWGSCTEQKKISLNWRLILAPRWVSDYVICHELCHLKHLNHSKDFWNLVELACPNYKDAENWMKTFEPLLNVRLEKNPLGC